MNAPTPRFWRYESRGASHPIMSFGDSRDRQILILPPLFEELNRTRKLIADTMRNLAAVKVATHLPDLPATGESETRLTDVDWEDWKQAVKDASSACGASAIVSVRGGCLLDGHVQDTPVMRFSPVEGKRLIRDLIRARSITDQSFDSAAQKAVFTDGPTIIGGYPVSADLACALRDAEIASSSKVLTARLENEHGEADVTLAGPPLWRRAEPTGSPELAALLTTAIVNWLV